MNKNVTVRGALPRSHVTLSRSEGEDFALSVRMPGADKLGLPMNIAFALGERARVVFERDSRPCIWIESAAFDLATEDDARRLAEAFALPIVDKRTAEA